MRIRAVYFVASRRETASIEWMFEKNYPSYDYFIPRIEESVRLWVKAFPYFFRAVYFSNNAFFFLAPARAQENSDDDSDDEAEDSDESDIPGK